MMHKLTLADIEQAIVDNGGWCLACGDETIGGIEPDAENYECVECGEHQVFGASQLLMMGCFKESTANEFTLSTKGRRPSGLAREAIKTPD